MKANICYHASVAMLAAMLPLSGVAADQQITLAVEHMTCATCPIVVKGALYDLDGVNEVKVSMEEKSVTVTYDDKQLNSEQLAEAVTNAGYPAKVAK